MNETSHGAEALAIAVAGVAGSGKSTLGRALARSLGRPLLDLDSLTNPLLDRVGSHLPTGHWLSAPDDVGVREARYAALREVARDVVATADGAVLVAPFTAELRGGRAWQELAEAVRPASLRMVHIIGEADLFEARRGHRGADRDRYRRADGVAEPPAVPVIPVDADLTTGQQLTRLRLALGLREPVDPANVLFGLDFDAVLFDLDGSLVDSTASVLRSWRRFTAELNVSAQARHDNHGQPARVLLAKLLPAERVEDGLTRITELEIADAVGLSPVLGAPGLFNSVPDDRRAIVTSGSIPLAWARLAGAGFARPAVLVTADDVGHAKPDPEPYLLAAQRLGVDPARCLVVEDAAAGIRSAAAAGCRVLAVAGTVPTDELRRADLVVDALDRLAIRSDDSATTLRLLATAGTGK